MHRGTFSETASPPVCLQTDLALLYKNFKQGSLQAGKPNRIAKITRPFPEFEGSSVSCRTFDSTSFTTIPNVFQYNDRSRVILESEQQDGGPIMPRNQMPTTQQHRLQKKTEKGTLKNKSAKVEVPLYQPILKQKEIQCHPQTESVANKANSYQEEQQDNTLQISVRKVPRSPVTDAVTLTDTATVTDKIIQRINQENYKMTETVSLSQSRFSTPRNKDEEFMQVSAKGEPIEGLDLMRENSKPVPMTFAKRRRRKIFDSLNNQSAINQQKHEPKMQSKLSDKCCERQPHIPSTTFICPNIKALDIYQQIVSNMSQNPHLHLQPKIDSLSPALLHGLRNANIQISLTLDEIISIETIGQLQSSACRSKISTVWEKCAEYVNKMHHMREEEPEQYTRYYQTFQPTFREEEASLFLHLRAVNAIKSIADRYTHLQTELHQFQKSLQASSSLLSNESTLHEVLQRIRCMLDKMSQIEQNCKQEDRLDLLYKNYVRNERRMLDEMYRYLGQRIEDGSSLIV